MICGSCGFGADFLTSCHHTFCFACFSVYINHKPAYPINCLCCERILTPKECLENLFGDDKEVFKQIRDSFLMVPVKKYSQRTSLTKSENESLSQTNICDLNDPDLFEHDREIFEISNSGSLVSRPTKKRGMRIPLKYRGKYECVSEKEIYKFKDPVCERLTCPICQEPHTPEDTCDQWRRRAQGHLRGRKKMEVESHLVAYAKFINVYGRVTENELVERFKTSGWMHTRRNCVKPYCTCQLIESTTKGKPIWRCYKCKSTVSIKHSTWFSKSWLSYFDILQMTFCWILGLSQHTTREITGKSKFTILFWFKKCRRHTIEVIERTAWRIGGPGIHVEVDEVMFGRARIFKGSRRPPQWYIGLIEQGNVQSLMVLPIADCNRDTLESVICKWVVPGSIIHTDEWFSGSNLHCLGYEHVINHGVSSFETAYGGSVDSMESTWNVVRSGCPQKGSKRKYMTSYIMAKIWRQRHESLSSLEKFERFMRSTLNCQCSNYR